MKGNSKHRVSRGGKGAGLKMRREIMTDVIPVLVY